MKNFTYKDISKIANVSISTISRYYNNGYVSKATRKKIESVVKANDYYPNHGARLIKGRDNSIFIIKPEWAHNHTTDIINGIVQGAKKTHRNVVVTHTEDNDESYIQTVKYVLSWKPSAIVLFFNNQPGEQFFKYISESVKDTPLVSFGYDIPNCNSIKIDYETSFNSLTMKFANYIEDGQKVVFVADTKLTPQQRDASYLGFKTACEKANLSYELYTLENKNPTKIQHFLKYLRDNNLVNVVCSNHEVFINLISSGDRNLRLTDIGNYSIYDIQSRYYSKIFIDYVAIGLDINRIANNAIADNTVETIIKKPTILTK